jgi:hypothetical protein
MTSTGQQAATTTIINSTNLTPTNTSIDTTVYYDDTLDIFLPFVFGLFVALALGWMVIRYKMTNNTKGSHYTSSFYCCPERCFTSMGRFRKRRYFYSFSFFLFLKPFRFLSSIGYFQLTIKI